MELTYGKSGKVAGWPITGVDHGSLDIALVNRDNYGRLGRNIDLAVVVGRGLLRGFALQISNRRSDGITNERADILQDGHGLLAIDDVLDGGFLSILTGDDIARDILVSGKGIGNGAGGAIIGGEDEDIALVGGGSGGQVGFSQVLGNVEVPVGGDLADDLAHLVTGQCRLVL